MHSNQALQSVVTLCEHQHANAALIDAVVAPYRDAWQNVLLSEAIQSIEFAARGGKARQCKKGYSCGNSCIARNRKCRKKHSAEAKQAQEWLKNNSASGGAEAQTPNTSSGVEHKPLMSESDAVEFTKDSVWADRVFYHGTTSAAAESITTDGIDNSRNLTAIYGAGFYMGGGDGGKDIASTYARDKGDNNDAEVLEMKVNVRNPKVATAQELKAEIDSAIADGTLTEPDFSNAQTGEDFNRVQSDYNQSVQDFFKGQGFDAVQVSDLDFFIAFDPEQVAIYRRELLDDEN